MSFHALKTPWWRHDLALTVLGLVLLLAWERSGWDWVVMRWYGTRTGFYWRDVWLTSQLLHQGGRWLALVVCVVLALDAVRPFIFKSTMAGPSRAQRGFWLVLMLACGLLIPLLKHFSSTSCPWDLQEFGGTTFYIPHWQWGIKGTGPGHCFPAGHPVAAFALLGNYFLWRDHHPRGARLWLFAVLLFGLAFGWLQLIRGAHFVSHTLWSAWLCWSFFVVASALTALINTKPVKMRGIKTIAGDPHERTLLVEKLPGGCAGRH